MVIASHPCAASPPTILQGDDEVSGDRVITEAGDGDSDRGEERSGSEDYTSEATSDDDVQSMGIPFGALDPMSEERVRSLLFMRLATRRHTAPDASSPAAPEEQNAHEMDMDGVMSQASENTRSLVSAGIARALSDALRFSDITDPFEGDWEPSDGAAKQVNPGAAFSSLMGGPRSNGIAGVSIPFRVVAVTKDRLGVVLKRGEFGQAQVDYIDPAAVVPGGSIEGDLREGDVIVGVNAFRTSDYRQVLWLLHHSPRPSHILAMDPTVRTQH